ncbi:MAG TPA: type II secretion system ATPase GspE [Acidiferrobacter sp.]|nr:type II secretion system ATPase GspE [Acidiferrobacter sp.]
MSDGAERVLDPQWVGRLPYHFAKRHGVMSVGQVGDEVDIWSRQPIAGPILAELERVLRRPLRLTVVGTEAFSAALNNGYAQDMSQAQQIMGDIDANLDLAELAQRLPQTQDLLEGDGDAPVVRLINALLTQAVRERASDIHIEPFESRSLVRFRVDGVLRDVIEPQKAAHGVVVSRIKIMSRLDIAEKRMPQDGRITLRLAGRPIDVRVSTVPTAHGERVVLRLLDKQAGRLNLSGLGMADDTLQAVRDVIAQPHGIFLVTGPTGAGKTTTLYSVLSEFDTNAFNMMTVEDPVEYELDGVGQIQVNPKIDLDFARALRAVLRQDPDIVMIGEIRDLETARIAVQASLTGHLVLATLHTNNAVGAVTRLIDMGVAPFLVASSLLGVLAQRLVRMTCGACHGRSHAIGATCAPCGTTGYRGRTGIYELLRVNHGLKALIHERAAEARLHDWAVAQGLRTLHQDGLRLVAAGQTSMTEVLRVARERS